VKAPKRRFSEKNIQRHQLIIAIAASTAHRPLALTGKPIACQMPASKTSTTISGPQPS
jgi:hypothetical protein